MLRWYRFNFQLFIHRTTFVSRLTIFVAENGNVRVSLMTRLCCNYNQHVIANRLFELTNLPSDISFPLVRNVYSLSAQISISFPLFGLAALVANSDLIKLKCFPIILYRTADSGHLYGQLRRDKHVEGELR